MIAIPVVVFVVVLPHLMAVPVCFVAIAVSISIPRYLPATVPPSVVCVMIVSSPVIGIMIVCVTTVGCVVLIVTEAWIVSEACFVLASPLPIFLLALTVQPVVLDIVVAALCQPLPVIRIILPVVAAGAVIGVVSSISVLCASGRHDCPQSQS
jgi:hypothetical protein